MSKKIRCALYDRVSTENQVEHGISLDTQKDALTDYALNHGYEIVGYYSDEGITARKKMQNRKELLRLLDDVKRDKIDLILVTKLDRWFRNIKDYHNTQSILEAHNCNWKTIFEDYDTSTSNGRFAINIMLSVNENECDRDSERIKSVFAYKKKNRELLSGTPAYGYITVDKKLQKDPNTRHIVEDTIQHYFSCYSKRNTVFYIQGKYGKDAPSEYKINRILGNCKTYTGEMYGIQGYCEPYLTLEQYQKIQSVSDSKTYRHTNGAYLFSQLIRCPSCSAAMTGFVKKQTRKDGGISFYKRYRCYKKFQNRHNSACISESVIEDYMIHHVTLDHKIYQIKSRESAAPKDNTEKIKAELSRLNILFQKGRISESYYDKQYDLLDHELKEELERRNILSSETSPNIREHFSSDWLNLYKKLDAEHKRAFWKNFIKEIQIDPDTHKISGFEFLV